MSERRQHARRAEDKKQRPWEPENAVLRAVWDARRDIWSLLLTIFVVLSIALLAREGHMREDGQCASFERDHLEEVRAVATAYAYFQTVEPEDYDTAIFRFAVRQLPIIEAAANSDEAPNYCDKPGVGLEEPDPVVPPRPQRLNRLPLPDPPPPPD